MGAPVIRLLLLLSAAWSGGNGLCIDNTDFALGWAGFSGNQDYSQENILISHFSCSNGRERREKERVETS